MGVLAGALTVSAGLVHAAAAGGHTGQQSAVALFALTAALQVALGAGVWAGTSRRALVAAVAVNVVVALAWAASRTSGLPFLDGFGAAEPVGVQDVAATLAEVAAAACAVVALRREAAPRPARLSPALVLALVPALVGMAAPSAHLGHHHAGPALAHDPLFAGADTSHASTAELEAAKRLIETTRAEVGARFPDQAALLPAG